MFTNKKNSIAARTFSNVQHRSRRPFSCCLLYTLDSQLLFHNGKTSDEVGGVLGESLASRILADIGITLILKVLLEYHQQYQLW